MPLPLFPPAFPVPSASSGAAGQHFDIDSGFTIPSAPNGTMGSTFEIESGIIAPDTLDSIKANTVVADPNITNSEPGGEPAMRQPFTCTSLRESFLVGRDDAAKPVEGQIVRSNPTHVAQLPSGVSDTDGYALMIFDVDNLVDAPVRETDKVHRSRLAGGRGRRGGQP